jgi:hypothetical protein
MSESKFKMDWSRAKVVYDTRDVAVSTFDAVLMMELSFGGYVPEWLHMSTGRVIYRVDTRKQHIEVRAWGIGESTNVVAKEVMRYDSVQALPEWMQRKIAVLMTFDPTKVTDEIPDLGARVSDAVFWVFGMDGETLGCDPRSEGQSSGT